MLKTNARLAVMTITERFLIGASGAPRLQHRQLLCLLAIQKTRTDGKDPEGYTQVSNTACVIICTLRGQINCALVIGQRRHVSGNQKTHAHTASIQATRF